MGDLIDRIAALSPEKRALLQHRLKKTGPDAPGNDTIPRKANRNSVPLSFAQQRLWFLDQLKPNSSVYNIPRGLRLKGPLNIAALEQSLNEIVRRHEALRTTFAMVDGQPVQIISPFLSLSLAVVDLTEHPKSARESEAQRLAAEEGKKPFDLGQGPLFRPTLIKLAEDDHMLFSTLHHIVSDGWSMGVLFRELSVLYQALTNADLSPLADLPIQYADYAVWQREWLQGEVLESQLSYWKKQLERAPAVLNLPTDRPRPAVQSFRGQRQSIELSKELTEGLKGLSRKEGVTLFMTLLAAFQTLLHRYTGQDDIVVGSPIANRNRHEIESLIGFFVNTLVMRSDLSSNPPFRQLLARVREVALGAYAHKDLPFEKLVEELHPERSLSHSPLFQVMFVLQNALSTGVEFEGLSVSSVRVGTETAKFDLTLSMHETVEGLSGSLQYNTDLFDDATITRMLEHFQILLKGIVVDPHQRISDLPILTEAEKRQLLVEWNDTKRDYPKDKCIHELFEEQVERSPDAIAVVFEDQQLTYRELNTRANQLAHYLGKLGVGPEVLVGICVERSIDMIVGLLGILKAGGAYVPLDPSYPQERLAFMLEDTQAAVLLTQERLIEKLPAHGAQLVCLDKDRKKIAAESDENPTSGTTAENLAYVIYTSGSTGEPKGVAITHASSMAFLSWVSTVFSATEMSGVLASTSICFDLSVFEIFSPLSYGGRIILVQNALSLASLSAGSEVMLINTVPSALNELLRVRAVPPSVCTINLAGEPLKSTVVEEIYDRTSASKVYDLYGPSEDTTYSTFALRTADGPQTIGKPIANTRIYILDTHLQPVPIGIAGELYIGGDGLARGYLNRSELTADKFIPNPFSDDPNSRLYRTGDLARYLSDGSIEFLGRIDNQVKIRGFRIELGEIEAILSRHPFGRETVVLAREDSPGDKRLVAYVVSNQDQVCTGSALRSFLKEKLPEYMIPSGFVFLDALPLTPSRKVDRKALPAPDQSRPELEQSFVAPRTLIEEIIVEIWAEVLKTEKVGIHDNFFELGGHSLLATQVTSRLREGLGVELPLRALFEAPTVAELAERIEQRESAVDKLEDLACNLAEMELLSDDEASVIWPRKANGKQD